MAGEGEQLCGTHVNTKKFYAEEKDGQLYVNRERDRTLLKVARVGRVEGSLFAGGSSADPAARRESQV